MRVEKRTVKDGIAGSKVERFVTLTEGDSGIVCKGKANVKYDRIHFQNGATWIRKVEKVEDERADERPVPQIQEEAIHGAAPFCGFMCGAKPMPAESAEGTEGAKDDAPIPPPKSLEEGFFPDSQIDDIVDRINDVIGIWGVSEETEAAVIKPQVVKMNKIMKVSMETFLDNPIIDLFQYLMDEGMSMMAKAKALGKYMHERFVIPLTEALMSRLVEEYKAVSWMKDKVTQVVQMMAQMVTDELMTRSVEQINDAEVADLEDQAADT